MYDITFDASSSCFSCGVPSLHGVCPACRPRFAFSNAWVVAERRDQMKRLLEDYKFERVYAAHQAFADLLNARLPLLPAETVVVPIPTIPRHVRQRGYDHAALIARTFARRRRLRYQPILKRKTNTVQVGANRATRRRQAEEAFICRTNLSSDTPYLIIDDIITTGATLQAAATCLQKAGASQVMVAAIAQQSLKLTR